MNEFNILKGLIETMTPYILFLFSLIASYAGWKLKQMVIDNKELNKRITKLETTVSSMAAIDKQRYDELKNSIMQLVGSVDSLQKSILELWKHQADK